MNARPGWAGLAALMALSIAGCSGEEPLTAPPVAQQSPSSTPTTRSPSPSPTPTPTPTPAPLSPFEDDPAVQGLRAYLVAVAQAVNANDLLLPALTGLSTASRIESHQELYGDELGTHHPFPNPAAVLGVQVVSPTERTVLACVLQEGLPLDMPGGTPVEPRLVAGGAFELLLEDGVWKVDDGVSNDDVSCDGVPLQPEVG